jgi:hypothetical protein
MSSVFTIKEHTLECQHIREYARATATSQEDVLHLAIKQYIPLDNPNPKEGDITIIGAHANGFPKASHSRTLTCLKLTCNRNYMNPSGRISTPVQKAMVSGFEVFG